MTEETTRILILKKCKKLVDETLKLPFNRRDPEVTRVQRLAVDIPNWMLKRMLLDVADYYEGRYLAGGKKTVMGIFAKLLQSDYIEAVNSVRRYCGFPDYIDTEPDEVDELTANIDNYLVVRPKYTLEKDFDRLSIGAKPYKKKTISKALRRHVWEEYMGDEGSGACYCCNKTTISVFDFVCGHVIAEKEGGATSVENLRPVCALCNSSMGSRNMEEFMRSQFGIEVVIEYSV
jgi:hypothetical protein